MATRRLTWTCSQEFFDRYVATLPAEVNVSEVIRKAVIATRLELGLDDDEPRPSIEGQTQLFEEAR